jgi:hypothetical protein
VVHTAAEITGSPIRSCTGWSIAIRGIQALRNLDQRIRVTRFIRIRLERKVKRSGSTSSRARNSAGISVSMRRAEKMRQAYQSMATPTEEGA